MNIIYVVLMTMHVDNGNTYRLNRLLPFFSDDLWTLCSIIYVTENYFCKKSYHLKVKSFDFLLLATFL